MPSNLEQRVTALEQQIAELKRRANEPAASGRQWLDDLYGKFEGDPIFERAMKLGRQYRRSLRPKSRHGKTAK